jgi:hypothetical protein
MEQRTKLRAFREQVLGVPRDDIVRHSKTLTLSTYRRAESGFAVKYSTAVEIVETFNNILALQKKTPVTMADLDINLE